MTAPDSARSRVIVRLQAVLVALFIGLLILPPRVQAGQIALSWLGGTGNYTDGNWCLVSCGSVLSGAVPINTSAVTYAASIDSGGTDAVTLNANGVVVDSMMLGGSAGSSTLYSGSNSITFGSPTSTGNVLTIGDHGVLNLQSGGSATIDTTASTAAGVSPAFMSTGTINVYDGAMLTFRDASGSGTFLQNDGMINLTGTTDGASLIFDSSGNGTAFDVFSLGTGTLNLTGKTTVSGATGTENLINDAGHTINVYANSSAGTATISSLFGFTNAGTINIGTSATGQQATLTPTAAATVSLVIDTTNAPFGFSNTYPSASPGAGFINVNDGAQLTFRNTSGQTAIFNNDTLTQTTQGITTPGGISLGTITGATLTLDDGGTGTAFYLTSNSQAGVLVMNGNSVISGVSGTGVAPTASLINDVGHTISNTGMGSISNLAGFANYGTLNVASGMLTVSANLTNWYVDSSPGGTGGTLNSGTYTVASGATLQLSALGSNVINTLINANVSAGPGGLTNYNGSDALTSVSSIQNSNLYLSGVGYTLGQSGSLTVAGGAATLPLPPGSESLTLPSGSQFLPPAPTSLTLDNGSNVLVGASGTGALTNTVSSPAPSASGSVCQLPISVTSGVCLQNGSTLKAGSLMNQATGGNAVVAVTSGSTLTISGDVSQSGASGGAAEMLIDGSNSKVSLGGTFSNNTGSVVQVQDQGTLELTAGNLMNSGLVMVGNSFSSATLELDNGTYTQEAGTTVLEKGGSLDTGIFDLQDGSLTGDGTLDANLDQTGGTFNPGGDPQSFDITGFYDLDGGTLQLDLGSAGIDQLNVTGEVSLDGSLDIDLLDGFVPGPGVYDDVISAGSVDPLFDQLSFSDAVDGLSFTLQQDAGSPDSFDLIVTTPEPGSLYLLFGAMLIGGFVVYRRRRTVSVN